MGGVADAIGDAVGGLAGGLTGVGGAEAARKGSRAQERYMREAMGELDTTYEGQQALLDPYLQTGNSALAQYAGLFGIGTGADGTNGAPDYSQFFQNPGYQFQQEQGENALARMQAARGSLFSGGAGRELAEYNNGLANQSYNDYANRLGALANLGPQTGNQLANYLGQKGQGKANLLSGIGDARAAGYVGAANSYSNAGANLLNFASSIWGGGGAAQGNAQPNNYSPQNFYMSGYNPSGMFG